jgi:hypothetical protein
MVTHIFNPSYMGGTDTMKAIQGQPLAKTTRPYLKNKLKQKSQGHCSRGRALPSKHKALSSNPNIAPTIYIEY